MKLFLSATVLLALAAYAASQCQQELNCLAANGCRCAGHFSPIDTASSPQFVVLSFNDAISDSYYTNYYAPLLEGRFNPDNNPVSASFYVPHEYTDYSRVNALYNAGYEIAVHSITKNPLSEYWHAANFTQLLAEFQGQRQIISQFANIPEEDIIGARVPNFALAGDALFQAYEEAGIQYDATWTAMNANPIFPFTLDVEKQQPCVIGICPEESHRGLWVAPIINLNGDGVECNNLQACRLLGDAEEITAWLTQEFLAAYEANRPPLNLVASAAWFMTNPDAFEGLKAFLDSLVEYNDVFIVSNSQVVQWARNPVPASSFDSAVEWRDATCDLKSCALQLGEEYRYMVSCVACPASYPWLNNPLGNTV